MLNGSTSLETKNKMIAFVIAAAEWSWEWEYDERRLTLRIADLPHINYHIYGKKKASYEHRSHCFFPL